jgi:hypothetical protein
MTRVAPLLATLVALACARGPVAPSSLALAVSSDPGHDRGAAYLFDDDAPPRTYRIEVAPADWDWLQAHATEETWVPARVVFEGQAWEGASVRYKGSYGTLYSCFDAEGVRTCPKLSLKVSFNEVDPHGRFFGLRKLVLNACHRDPSALRERMAYALFREAGLVAPRAVHARVQVNDEPAGLYLLVEDVDKEFLQAHFAAPEGNLYKEAWPFDTDPAAYVAALETNEQAVDVQRLVALAGLLRTVSPGDFDAALAPWLDREAWLRYLAVDLFVNDWDGITKFYCGLEATGRAQCGNHNFYLYDDPLTGRFVVIPWDQDQSLSEPNVDLGRSWWDTSPEACVPEPAGGWFAVLAPQCDPLLGGLLVPHWAELVQVLGDAGAEGGFLDVAVLQARLDRYRAQILPIVEADPAGPAPAEWRRAASRLREILAAQAAEVEALGAWSPPN